MRIGISVSIGVIIVALLSCCTSSQAQMRVNEEVPDWDTLEVVFRSDQFVIKHTTNRNENLFILSRMYRVPPALLKDLNSINFQSSLNTGTEIYVPYGPYNQVKTVMQKRSDVRPLFYVVKKYDNLYSLAHLAGKQQKQIQQWNGMSDNYIEEGQKLFIGWVHYNNTPVKQVAKTRMDTTTNTAANDKPTKENRVREVRTNDKGETVIVYRKVTPYDTLPEIHKVFLSQTDYEKVITEEKGAAVFYENRGKLAATDLFFAFHNTAKPGTIIRVHNPGTDKTIFVKVLGAIPDTKLYHNCIIGINDGAKQALLVSEDKAWCELTFAPPL